MVTGSWSAKASKEAAKFLNVNKVLNPPLKSYTSNKCINSEKYLFNHDVDLNARI